MPRVFRFPFAALIVATVLVSGCGGGEEVTSTEVVVIRRASVPDGPDDTAWQGAPVHRAQLILQDMVEPRLLEPSTTEVGVRAITDGGRIVFRLEWTDGTRDDLPGSDRFSDACAVQLPSRIEPDLPAPQMGEEGRPVEILYWRASWQASVDGRADDIRSLYPGATVDHYPFEAETLDPGSDEQVAMETRYAPARAVGNYMEGARTSAVEALVAAGPGTLEPAGGDGATGRGLRTEDGWAVVLARPLPDGLGGSGRGQIAFAVWQGAKDEVGSRKMRTGWIPMAIGGTS